MLSKHVLKLSLTVSLGLQENPEEARQDDHN